MKKLILLTLITFVFVFTNAQVIPSGASGLTLRTNVNNKFTAHDDSITALRGSSDQVFDSITSLRSATNQNYGFIASHNDSITVLRALAESKLSKSDSLLYYITPKQLSDSIAGLGSGGYTDLTSFVDQTAWRVFYSDGSGDVTELALGADGTYLKSNGATSAPTFDTPAGSGDLSKSDSLTIFSTPTQVSSIISDSLTATLSGAEVGVSLADSAVYDGGYVTPTMLDGKANVEDTITLVDDYGTIITTYGTDSIGIKIDTSANGLATQYDLTQISDGSGNQKDNDIEFLFEYGSGVGQLGDTVLVVDSLNAYGVFERAEDSTQVQELKIYVSSGDTLNAYLVSGATLWTPTDTLCTINAGAGRTTITSFTNDTFPEDVPCWIEMGATVETRKPIQWRALLYGIKIRD